MESWENKTIADKLNGLQELPDGYSPNIASKWEIVQAGLSGKKKASFKRLWLLCLLALLIAFVTIWSLDSLGKPDKQKSIRVAEQTNQPVNKKQLTRIKPETVPTENHVKIEVINTQRTKPSNSHQHSGDTAAIAPDKIAPVLVSFDSVIHIQTDTVRSFLPIATLKPKPRLKTYQKDFEGLLTNIDTGQVKTAKKGLQIKFSPQYNRDFPPERQPSLRLTQNF